MLVFIHSYMTRLRTSSLSAVIFSAAIPTDSSENLIKPDSPDSSAPFHKEQSSY